MSNDLKNFISLVIESRLREADVTDGKAPWGSESHISDLEMRIADLIRWRDRQRRGSESRANYSRLVSRLKAELASAKRHSVRLSQGSNKLSEVYMKMGDDEFDIPEDKVELLKKFINDDLGIKQFDPSKYLEGYDGYPEAAVEIERALEKSYPQNKTIQNIVKKIISQQYPAEVSSTLNARKKRMAGIRAFINKKRGGIPGGTFPVPEVFRELADIKTDSTAGSQIGRGELALPLMFPNTFLGGSNSAYDVSINGENWHVKEEKPRIGSKMGATSDKLVTSLPIMKLISRAGFDISRFSEMGMNVFANVLPEILGGLSNTFPEAFGSFTLQDLYRRISTEARDAAIGDAQGIIWYSDGQYTFTPKDALGVKFFTQGGRIGLSTDSEEQVFSRIGKQRAQKKKTDQGRDEQ